MNRLECIRQLRRTRTRSLFLRVNGMLVVAATCAAWLGMDVRFEELFSARRWNNLRRFAAEAYPYPLRDEPFRVGRLMGWVGDIWSERGAEATAVTFDISVVAILMAGMAAGVAALCAARNFAATEPFLPGGRAPTLLQATFWSIVVGACRGLLVLARAIPEYIWAFLLVGMLGPGAWPAILALALHNFGILGKLGAEIVENTDTHVPAALRGKGLTRGQIAAVALLPALLNKGLLFFFYRWETCVREATVLGMLGVGSLGYWIRDSRAKDAYDELLVFVALGAALVLAGDIVSALIRYHLRRR